MWLEPDRGTCDCPFARQAVYGLDHFTSPLRFGFGCVYRLSSPGWFRSCGADDHHWSRLMGTRTSAQSRPWCRRRYQGSPLVLRRPPRDRLPVPRSSTSSLPKGARRATSGAKNDRDDPRRAFAVAPHCVLHPVAVAVTNDLIFDLVGATTFDRCKHLGIYLSCIMGLPDVARSLWTSMASSSGQADRSPHQLT